MPSAQTTHEGAPLFFEAPVSQFDGIKPRPLEETPTVQQIINYLSSDTYLKADIETARGYLQQELEENRRDEKGKLLLDEYNNAKKNLPGVTWAGTFRERYNKDLLTFSGFMSFDIDFINKKHPEKIEYEDVRQKARQAYKRLTQDEYTAFLFPSVSATGIKGLVKIPHVTSDAEYKTYFRAYQEYARNICQQELDPLCDIARLCFLSYCDNPFLNRDASLFTQRLNREDPPPQETQTTCKDPSVKAAVKVLLRYGIQKELSRNDFVGLCAACKRAGIAYDDFDNIMQKTPGYNQKENFRIWNTADPQPREQAMTVKTLIKFARETNNQLYEEELTNIQHGVQSLPEWAFWEYELYNKNLRVSIKNNQYLRFLENWGYRVFMRDATPEIVAMTGDSMNYVEHRGNLYSEIKASITSYLVEEGFENVADILVGNSKYFHLDILEMLPTIPRENARHSIFSEVETDIALDMEYEDEQILIAFENDPINTTLLTTDNYISFTADTGVGKSLLTELFTSMMLCPLCEPQSHFRVHSVTNTDDMILWLDGERAKADVGRSYKSVLQRIKMWHKWDGEEWENVKECYLSEDGRYLKNLKVLGLKGVDDKIFYIKEYIESMKQKPIAIFVDSVLDLLRKGMNEEEDAIRLTNLFDKLTKKLNCGLVAMVHASSESATKKSDGTGLGHAGKYVGRGACARLNISHIVTPDGREIKHITTNYPGGKVRNGPRLGVDDFYEWHTEDKMPHFIDYTPPEKQSPQEREGIELRVFLQQLLYNTALRRKEIIDAYVIKKQCSTSTAKRAFDAAVNIHKIIEREENGARYMLCHKEGE